MALNAPSPLDPPVSPSPQHDRSEIREANHADEKRTLLIESYFQADRTCTI